MSVPKLKSALAFEKIYKTNAEKLMMPPEQRYPINETASAEWLAELQKTGAPEDVLEFVRVFLNKMQNISFDQFYRSLRRAAQRLNQMCAQNGYEIVMIVPTTSRKSNFWVSLLVWPFIRDYVTQVDGVGEDILWSRVLPNKTYYLYADDAAFTGNQAADLLRLNRAPAFARVEVCVLVPFTTKQARDHIARTLGKEPLFMRSRMELASLSEFFTTAEINSISRYPGFVHLAGMQSMAYFDHKMPDTLSTTNWLFALAPVYRGPGKFDTRSLVTGCSAEDVAFTKFWDADGERRKEVIATYLSSGATPVRLDDARMCPPRFSATIEYTWPTEIDKDSRWRLPV